MSRTIASIYYVVYMYIYSKYQNAEYSKAKKQGVCRNYDNSSIEAS